MRHKARSETHQHILCSLDLRFAKAAGEGNLATTDGGWLDGCEDAEPERADGKSTSMLESGGTVTT